MTGASAVTTAIRRAVPTQKVLMVGGHVAALPGADAGRGGLRLRRTRRGPLRGRRLDRGASRRRRARPVEGARARLPFRAWRGEQSGRAARDGRRDRDAGRRVGSAADGPVPRAQLALLRPPRAAAVRRDLHDARLSVPLLVLLHPGAVQGRRAGGRHQGVGQQLPLLEPGAGRRRRSIGSSTGTASATSSSPTRCSC